MNKESNAIRPRSRRRTGRIEASALSPAEQSTRLLIEVPMVMVEETIKAVSLQAGGGKAVLGSAQTLAGGSVDESSAAHLPTTPTGAAGSRWVDGAAATATPAIASAAPQPTTITRIDASHGAAGSPHLTAPEWLDDSSGVLSKLTQTKVVVAVAVAGAIVWGAIKLSDRNHHAAKADVVDPQIQTSQQDAPYQPRVPAGSAQTSPVDWRLPAAANKPASVSPSSGAAAGAFGAGSYQSGSYSATGQGAVNFQNSAAANLPAAVTAPIIASPAINIQR